MGARLRKVRADARANPARTVLAVLSLAVGTIAVGAMLLAGSTLRASSDASFAASNPPSAMLGTTPFGAEVLERVRDHPDVAEADGRRLLRVRAAGAGGDPVTLELVAMADFAENRVSRIAPRRGSWPPAPGGMVVERASLEPLGADLGDTVRFTAPDGGPARLRVTGTAFDAWEVSPSLGGAVRGYVAMDTMAALTGSREMDTLYLRAAREPLSRSSALAVTAAVRDDVLTPAGVAIELSEIRDPSVHRSDNAVTFLVTAMQVLAVLALAIAVLLVVNTVTALLTSQRRHIGVMKAVGATSGQLTAQYLGYVLLLAVAALAVAAPLSILAGRALAGFAASLANIELEPLGVPWGTLAVEAAIVLSLPLLAVLLAVRRACGVTVREAIGDRGLTGRGARGRLRVPVSRPALLAMRDATRNRLRLGLTVLTLGASGAVLVGVLSTGEAFGRLTDQVAGYWDYDIELALGDTVAADRAGAALADDPAVAGTEGWLRTQAFRIRPDGSENENVSITAVPTGSAQIRPTLIRGRWFAPGDDHPVVLNTHFASEEPDLRVGGPVLLDIEGNRREWTVVGVATTTLMGPVAYVPAAELSAVTGAPGRTNLVAVDLVPGADAGGAAERLEARALAAGLPVASVQTNAQLRGFVDGLFALVVGMLLVVAAFLAVVAVIGLAGTMTLGVIEQTREIGVLRTLGAGNGAVRRHFLAQGLAIAAVGGLLGVLLSLPVAWLLRSAMEATLIEAPVPWGFSWTGAGAWLALALLIGAVASTRPARTASRLTVRETLAYE